MKLSFHVGIALVLLPLQSVYAQGVKRDILGVSLGMPLPEVESREIIASAGEWTPPQEQLVPVGDYKCKKLGTPWKLSSGELSCKVDKSSHLSLDVALRIDPPTIQSIAYNFCSADEPSQVLDRTYKDYGVTNGLKEINLAVWGPHYKLDSRTTLTIGYSGKPCTEGKAYELKLQDFHTSRANTKNQQELIAKREERSITKKPERKMTKRQKRTRLAASTRKR
jgi:hypothetical protein